MIRRLINRLQGKRWAAACNMCLWRSGRNELTSLQASNRAHLHNRTAHAGYGAVYKLPEFHALVVKLPF